jgi:hypothetical protein
VLGLGVVLAILGPVLRRGYLLRYDLVFVPDPPFGAVVWGSGGALPRAVPSELLAVGLSQLLPSDLAEKVLLAGALALAAVGAARLAPVSHPVARIAAGLLYVWNPWVYGRLHLGQWAIIAGYAALPWAYAWVVDVVRRRADHPTRGTPDREAEERVGGVPARRVAIGAGMGVVLGGPALVLAAVLVCAPALALARRWRALAGGAAVLVGLTSPWLLALLDRSGALAVDERGVAAFAPRADTPLGVVGSVVTLGGIWTRNAVPFGRDRWAVAVLALALVVAAAWGFALLRRRWPAPLWWGLLVGAIAGMIVTVLPAFPAGERMVADVVAALPAAGAVRDSTRMLAPLALAQAVGLGLLVERLVALRVRSVAVLVAAAPVLLVPNLAWGLGGQLDTSRYPPEWTAVRAVVEAGPSGGSLVSLPWSSFRAYPWAGNVPVLDPAPRAFRRPVLGDQDVLVGRERIRGESGEADQVAAVLAAPGDPTPGLRRLGVRYVLIQADQPGAAEVRARFAEVGSIGEYDTLVLISLADTESGSSESSAGLAPVVGYGVLGITVMIVLLPPARQVRRMLLSGHLSRRDRQ